MLSNFITVKTFKYLNETHYYNYWSHVLRVTTCDPHNSQVSKITVHVIMDMGVSQVRSSLWWHEKGNTSIKVCEVNVRCHDTQAGGETWWGVWNTGQVNSQKLIDQNNSDWKTYWIFLHRGRWEWWYDNKTMIMKVSSLGKQRTNQIWKHRICSKLTVIRLDIVSEMLFFYNLTTIYMVVPSSTSW